MALIVLGHLLERVQRFHDGGGDTEIVSLIPPFAGCYLFFCISGYSLMAFLLQRQAARQRMAIQAYALRQSLRLCPPYFGVLLATYGFLTLSGYAPEGTRLFNVAPASLTTSLLASLTFSHYATYCTFPRLFPPGWFLETQIQFYLLSPLMFVFYLQVRAPAARLKLGAMLVLLTMIVSLTTRRYGPCEVQYSLLVFMPYFWIGAVFADVWQNEDHRFMAALLRRVPLAGWGALAVLVMLANDAHQHVILYVGGQLVCLAVIFVAALGEGSWFHRALAARWLAPVGVGCYSIYLVHLQVLQVVTPLIADRFESASMLMFTLICLLVGFPILLLASAAFYFAIERPWSVQARLLSRLWIADAPAVPGLAVMAEKP